VTAEDIAALGRFDRWLVDPPREVRWLSARRSLN
jgi:hypothetical protein